MAITSTLRKGSYNWVLRLVDASSSDRVDFPLLENYAPASLDLAAEGIVHESHRYRALLAKILNIPEIIPPLAPPKFT